ncbi:hypothetical protein VP1G_10031 [Cytospora mali]|uniref:Uncharacterized protein n=1 Tax=Cytospora mali TaxID=578113 RepID=A0A194VGI9_CYTMA|nr:hypothetical protein VP1G_10031 [Valsa mali var. pyri (nom. inval.)]
MNPTTHPSTPSTPLITSPTRGIARRPTLLPPPSSTQVRPSRGSKSPGGGAQVGVLVRVPGEHVGQHGQESVVLREGARRGRDLGRGAHRQARVGRVGVEIG